MTSRTIRDALVGLLYLIVIAALVALSIAFYNHDFTSYVKVGLRTDSTGNSLVKGSDVKVRGVLVGEVSSITTNGNGAVIHMELTPAKVKTLPANMTAALLPKTLFGERYVDLEFPSSPDGTLKSGDTLDQNTSRSSIELQRLFADLLPVLKAVQPEKLAATLGELAQALRGRGVDLARTIHTVGVYLRQIAPHIPQVTDDLSALATTAQTYADAAPSLISGLNSLSTTSQLIAKRRADYTELLRTVTTMSRTVGTFLGTNKNNIISLSRDSLPSLRVTAKYAPEFPCLSRALVNYIPTANKAFGVGTSQVGAHVILHVIAKGKAAPYTSTDGGGTVSGGAPRCPYSPQTALASSALSVVPGATGTQSSVPDGSSSANGTGPANSPQENELIGELVAPAAGLQPSQYPKWASLLLGPALRGSEVTVK